MNQLSSKRIEMIVNKVTSGQALTIYMPTHQIPTRQHMDEDQIRFKNMMQKALKLIDKSGNKYFHAFLDKKFKDAMSNNLFWEQCTKSMLITARLGMFEVTHLPVDCDEYIALDDYFHLGPVYGLLYDMQDFHILHMAQKNPKLYKANNYNADELDIGLPVDSHTALQIDEEHQKSVQHHSGRNTQFHGHGGGKDSGDWEERQYMRIIDKLVAVNIDTSLPVVLAGTEHELGLYKSLSNLPNICDATISLNADRLDINILHEKAFGVIQSEIIDARREYAINAFRQTYAKSPRKTVLDAEALQQVSSEGRADTVLLAVWKRTTDTVRDNKNQVRKLVMPNSMNNKSVDAALEKAWKQGADIINVLASQLPKRSLLAANLRY